jgi:single-stranded DNA-binding protein
VTSSLPELNYAVITGVIKQRKDLCMTRSGIPVLHLLVKNTVHSPYKEQPQEHDIEVIAWGRLATAFDAKLKQGDPVLIEGMLVHRTERNRAGGEQLITVLKARRVEPLLKKERKA